MCQKDAWPRSRDLLFKFWSPPNISGTAENINLKCCMRIEGSLGSVTYFSNFGTHLIFPERLKIQTSNFARLLTIRDTEPKNAKLVKTGRGLDHVQRRSRDILNMQTTKALKNGKIRKSIAFDFQHGYQMWTWSVNFLDQKSKH